MTFAIDTAEKIETIVNSCLKSQTLAGAFGEVEHVGNNWYAVRADGVCALVTRGALHWHVRVRGIEGADTDLLTAAQMALEAA